jgi:hypothetical protein
MKACLWWLGRPREEKHRSAPIAVCSLGVRPCDLLYTF